MPASQEAGICSREDLCPGIGERAEAQLFVIDGPDESGKVPVAYAHVLMKT